jgi:predicted nucleic acid-binding protein
MLVVDANIVTKWFVDQVHSDRAERVQTSKQRLVAPQLMIAEVTDALRKHVRVGDISLDQARTALASLPRLFNEIVAMEQLADAALALARKIEHSAYDCFYLALAESRSARLVTADTRLIDRVARTKYKSHVIHLTDWI